MKIAADIAIGIVALLHVYFLVLEMFFWTRPLGRRTFGLSADFASRSARLAANQGLYNGFLAAGLVWGLLQGEAGFPVLVFFLACIVVAGVFGAFVVNRIILFVQGVPALIALALLFAAR